MELDDIILLASLQSRNSPSLVAILSICLSVPRWRGKLTIRALRMYQT